MGHNNIHLVMVKCINITTSALCLMLRIIFSQHSDYNFIQLTFPSPYSRQAFRGIIEEILTKNFNLFL